MRAVHRGTRRVRRRLALYNNLLVMLLYVYNTYITRVGISAATCFVKLVCTLPINIYHSDGRVQ